MLNINGHEKLNIFVNLELISIKYFDPAVLFIFMKFVYEELRAIESMLQF
jgi:hypothetical protein